jgi:cytoskeletal protein RodZ
MDKFEMQERKREARRRLRAQREKAGELRGRVVAISLLCFALLWGIVFVQMATGHDPVLGATSSTVAKRNGRADRHTAKANVVEAGASTDSEEPSSGEEELETSEAETIEPEVEPVEEEFIEAEPEPEPEFVEPEPEPEPAPVTTSQS